MPKEKKPPRVTIASLNATIERMSVAYHELEKTNAEIAEAKDLAEAKTRRLIDLVLGEDRHGIGFGSHSLRGGDRYTDALARITTFHQLEGKDLGAGDARLTLLSEDREWLRSFIERMSGLEPKRALRPGERMFKAGDLVALRPNMGCDLAAPGKDMTITVLLCREHLSPAETCRHLHGR